MKKPRVFVIEPCKVPVSSAAEHGDLEYVFKQNESRPAMWGNPFLQEIDRRFHGFDPDRDMICLAGHQVLLIIVLMHLVAKYGRLRVLLFNSVDRTYTPRLFRVEGTTQCQSR